MNQKKSYRDFQAEGKEYRQKLRSHTHKGMPKTGNTLGKWDISVQIFLKNFNR